MRHRIAGKKLNRSTGHRKALFKNLAKDLFIHGQITTTEAKAKAIKPMVDKLITRAKKQDLASRRRIQAFFNNKTVTNQLVDRIAPQLNTRTSGYTRIRRQKIRRGDNSIMVTLSLVDPLVVVEAVEAKESTKKVSKKSAK